MRISVVMAFRNEGDQVRKTFMSCLQSLNGRDAEIVIINDASNDGFDYRSDLGTWSNLVYEENHERLGSSLSKEKGVQLASGDIILLVDAHMRFIDSDWYDVVQRYTDSDPRKIYCLYTVGFNAETEEIKHLTHSCTWVGFKDKGLWASTWATKHLDEGDSTRVACLMGASYFFTKEYWNYLRGYEGLRLYGREEEFISIKSWGMGNGCELVKTCRIAHMYRDKAPQSITTAEVWYNILIIAFTLLPSDIKDRIVDKMIEKYPTIYQRVLGQLDKDKVRELSTYFNSHGYTYSKFEAINKLVKDLNYVKPDDLKTYAEKVTESQIAKSQD